MGIPIVGFAAIPANSMARDWRKRALEMARDALETAIEFYFEDNRIVPTPSKVNPGQDVVELPASLSAKVLPLNEMLSQRVTAAELARRLKTTPQTVQRIMDLDHATKIDTVAEAFRALGMRLDFQVKRGTQPI